ncbi:MAG: TIGR03905 family TSCPD domain-containing protein [Lachnospiraceae bacterium]|nr:TIGR03905 family TSCPD domain-containing protein [Lachnospiraceae bacterium]
MKEYSFTPRGVCSQNISFELDDENRIHNLSFIGGCNGNLKAIAKLCEGKEAAEVTKLLKGNDCRGRGTSCADQLTIALEKAVAKV